MGECVFCGSGEGRLPTRSDLPKGGEDVSNVTGAMWLAAITPIGGVSFVVAWALLFVGVVKERAGGQEGAEQ